jgi:hypothetical protein
MELWFRLRSGVSTPQYLLALNNASGGIYTILNISASKLATWIAAPAGAHRTSSTTLENGKLYYAVVTRPAGNSTTSSDADTRLYLNGVNEGGTTDPLVDVSEDPNHIGVFAIGGKEPAGATDRNLVDGQICLVRVYNRVLTPTEIANRYADPQTYDYVDTYASDLCLRADLRADIVARNGANGTTTTMSVAAVGSGALTPGYPLAERVPHPVVIIDAGQAHASGYNQVSSFRFTTLGDYSGNAMSCAESASSGMAQLVVDGLLAPKINVGHAAARPSVAKYYNKAAGSGHTFDARALTVVAWVAPRSSLPLNGASHENLLSIGDPAGSAGSSIFDVVMGSTGKLVSCRANSTSTDALSSDLMLSSARPRMIAIASDASGRVVQVDKIRKTGSAISAGTATGYRLGAEVGALANYSQQDIYRIEIHARKLSNAELDACYEAGKTPFKYADATRFLWCKGSSTFEGYVFDNANENMISQFQDYGPEWYIVSHAISGHYRANFIANYANEGEAFATAVLANYSGVTQGDLHALIQYMGNDYLGDLSRGNYATIASEYSAWFAVIEANFATVSLFVPIPRTDYALESQDLEREQFVQDMRSLLGVSAGRLIVERVAELTPTSSAYADLIFVSQNTSLYEQGDGGEVHIKNATTRLYRQYLQEFLDDLDAPTEAPTYFSAVPSEETVGAVVVTVEGVIGRVRVYSSATSGGARTLRGDSTTNSSWVLAGTVGTMEVDGLTEATEYYFTATNEDTDLGLSESAVSTENRATAGWEPPFAASVTSTAVGTNRLEINFAAGWFGTSFVERRLYGSGGAWTYVADESAANFTLNGDNTGTYRVSAGLLPNTKYDLRLASFIIDPDSGVDSTYQSVGYSDVYFEKTPPVAPRVYSVDTGVGTLKVVVDSGFVGRVTLYTSSTLNGTYTALKNSTDPEWSVNSVTGRGTFNVTGLADGDYYVKLSDNNFYTDGYGAESDLSSPGVLGTIDGAEDPPPTPGRASFLLYL